MAASTVVYSISVYTLYDPMISTGSIGPSTDRRSNGPGDDSVVQRRPFLQRPKEGKQLTAGVEVTKAGF
jgi:hypothetical protein